jgi:hypothetical protein
MVQLSQISTLRFTFSCGYEKPRKSPDSKGEQMRRFTAALVVITIAGAIVSTGSSTAIAQTTASNEGQTQSTACAQWTTSYNRRKPDKLHSGPNGEPWVAGWERVKQTSTTYTVSPGATCQIGNAIAPPQSHTWTSVRKRYDVPYAGFKLKVKVVKDGLTLCDLHYNAGEPDCQ